MGTIVNCEQRSDEWFALRKGRITASNFATAIGKGQTRTTLLHKLVAERITQEKTESFQNAAMLRGQELEPQALASYEMTRDVTVTEVGIVLLDDDIAASPDGLVDEKGGLEIKCPLGNTMVGYLLAGKLPAKYKAQVQGQMWVADLEWTDFYAWHPEMKHLIVRVERDDDYLKETLVPGINQFVEDMKTIVEQVKI